MKFFTLHYSCIIDASISEVCTFHTDTRNLPLITPPWIDVRILSMDIPIHENSQILLRIKRFGIPTHWKMRIAKLECPYEVSDEMISGPFRFFSHERRFEAISDYQTHMNETITMALGVPLFENIIFPFIRMDMDRMFAYRHKATQTYFKERDHVLSI